MTSSESPSDYRAYRAQLDADRRMRAEQAAERIRHAFAEAAGKRAVKQTTEVDHDD